jgi:hypothetical protein
MRKGFSFSKTVVVVALFGRGFAWLKDGPPLVPDRGEGDAWVIDYYGVVLPAIENVTGCYVKAYKLRHRNGWRTFFFRREHQYSFLKAA